MMIDLPAKETASAVESPRADTVLIALTRGEPEWDRTIADFRWSEGCRFQPLSKNWFATETRWIDL